MIKFEKYLYVIPFLDILEDGRIFIKERIVDNNGGKQVLPRRELKQHNVRGYYGINIMIERKNYHLFSHVLVKIFYDGLPSDLNMVVDHIDCNKTNNNINNLEWVTSSENNIRAVKNGCRCFSEKQRYDLSKRMKENNPMKNITTAKKVSDSCKGKKLTEEHKKKISEKMKGRVFKDETIRKLGKPIIGIKQDGCLIRFNSIREAGKNGYNRQKISESINTNTTYKEINWEYDN